MASDVRVIGALKETWPGEARVAISPEVARKYVKEGAKVLVEAGAGVAASFPDAEYAAAGVELAARGAVLSRADLLLAVRPPPAADVARLRRGCVVAGLLDPARNRPLLDACAAQGVAAYALELLPRSTRAQVMDALSSQANLAGYRAVI